MKKSFLVMMGVVFCLSLQAQMRIITSTTAIGVHYDRSHKETENGHIYNVEFVDIEYFFDFINMSISSTINSVSQVGKKESIETSYKMTELSSGGRIGDVVYVFSFFDGKERYWGSFKFRNLEFVVLPYSGIGDFTVFTQGKKVEEGNTADERRKAEEQQREAEQRRLAEEQRKREQDIQNLLIGTSGIGNVEQGSQGNGTYSTRNEDSPFENSDSGLNERVGGSFNLSGRSIRGGGLPRPEDRITEAGTIVINITVDPKGDVISAEIGRGTDINNRDMRARALDAAKRTKFSSIQGTSSQSGIIIYRYSMR